MRLVGELSLLCAFVSSAYAAFACMAGARMRRPGLVRAGVASGILSLITLTVTLMILAYALLVRDFSFAYVAQYSSKLLPWHYSLSALWVGQAGSLLLWAWMQAVLVLLFYRTSRHRSPELHQTAFGLAMSYVCFLVSTMVFGVNPMVRSIVAMDDGAGLSPLLQHPAMLIHPPVVFLAYAAWTIPCALALSAVMSRGSSLTLMTAAGDSGHSTGTPSTPSASRDGVSREWLNSARPWALFAWMVLGTGILLGANWSYEELGWGGYWAWDPVENGSLMPWLTGTAFLHGLMAWRFRGLLKKSTLALAIATFALCNFATFLTRSGIFSSLHAFSQSPIGWLFLGLLSVLGVAGGWAVLRRRSVLAPENRILSLVSCESQIIISAVALLLLAAVMLGGTLSVALSDALVGRRIMVGVDFYNNVLIPIGLTLLVTMAFAPLLRWGRGPTPAQRRGMRNAIVMACAVVALAVAAGLRHPLAVAVTGLVALTLSVLLNALWLDGRRAQPRAPWSGMLPALALRRRQYTGFIMHLGFICITIGITGSALGRQEHEVVLHPGESIDWAGRSIRFVQLHEREHPDKFIAEAELEISQPGASTYRLWPAQHFHLLQEEWTTEVAVRATWAGDFYTILHNGESNDGVRLTLIENPLMRWLWFGGVVMAGGTLLALWPRRSRSRQANRQLPAAVTRKVPDRSSGSAARPRVRKSA